MYIQDSRIVYVGTTWVSHHISLGAAKALFLANPCVGPERVAQDVVYKQELTMCNESSHTGRSIHGPSCIVVSFKAFCQHSWMEVSSFDRVPGAISIPIGVSRTEAYNSTTLVTQRWTLAPAK